MDKSEYAYKPERCPGWAPDDVGNCVLCGQVYLCHRRGTSAPPSGPGYVPENGIGVDQKVLTVDPSAKPSNPKDTVGIRKAPMSTVSAAVMAEVGVAMLEGAAKYGRHNYRAVGVRASVYYDA